MSKTSRSFPHTYFRCPRGSRAAQAHGDRAVPPSNYDDLSFGREHWLPWKIAETMRRGGWSDRKIAARLAAKYRLTFQQMQYVLAHIPSSR